SVKSVLCCLQGRGDLASGARDCSRGRRSMADLPGGTVTFLLTDVERSTALWEASPVAMHGALIRHDALFEAIVSQHQGVHIRPRGEGDSRFAIFASAPDALAAAQGQWERAVRLSGAAETLLASTHTVPIPLYDTALSEALDAARSALSDTEYATA